MLGLREARFCMTYMSFALKASILKPPINQTEVLTGSTSRSRSCLQSWLLEIAGG
jgi:hypothetical protein